MLRRRSEERAPVEEAGGGEAEGFEKAEEELIEKAEGEAGKGHPLGDRFPAEEADPYEHGADGEADDVRPADQQD
jgi:hypothetical protein